jgi:hypothetical protein
VFALLLLKGDKIRLHDGRVVTVVDVWGVARCHAKIMNDSGAIDFIIAENDVAVVIKRPAIRKSKFRD